MGIKATLAALALAGALASCGGTDEPPTAGEVRDQLGCVSFWNSSSQELYVADKYNCVYSSHQTSVYMFKDNDARDSWRDVAEHFGTVVVNEGDGWLEVRQ